ncbi:uncharacterized protein MONBRDRAFT_12455 [Monosiga brevicollis MX1]|uniref:WH2 domain-containing protein n=1 Tax=Monosiga brevicollis TaxID=81824 RepID=A9VCB7_MONBE|nr:uncharacterized protein MONBRDRAFT_12455 [Monosiga brevicollis MX1]EDQ84871.1 predicted protein [Monosiga brevicollis MX1]|eukprot:XP_001750372.1 hypothetical protein [Monosiga brevicollis MX1]
MTTALNAMQTSHTLERANRGSSQTDLSTSESIVDTYHGALYSCMQGDPEGWRTLTDGYIGLRVVHDRASIEHPFRIVSTGKGRELNLKITAETRLKRTKDTFIQWHAKGSCLSYGVQLVASAATDKLLQHLQAGVQLAKTAAEAKLRNAEAQHRLSHLNRTGQTTEAYQFLTDMSKKEDKQNKVLLKIHFPEAGSTMTLHDPSQRLTDVIEHIARKRKLDAHTIGVRLTEAGNILSSTDLTTMTVADVTNKTLHLVHLLDVVDTKRDKSTALAVLTQNNAGKPRRRSSTTEMVFFQVHLPDGGETVVSVPEMMSMGELLFYIAEKRSLSATDLVMAENPSGRKLVPVEGVVRDCKRRKIFLVEGKITRARRGSMFSGAFSSVKRGNRRNSSATPSTGVGRTPVNLEEEQRRRRKLEISEPTLQRAPSQTSLNDEPEATRRDVQRLTSLLAEGVALSDARMPTGFCDLCLRTNLTEAVQNDVGVRNFVLNQIDQHGGIRSLLRRSNPDLRSLFGAADKFKRTRSVRSAAPAPQPPLGGARGRAPAPPLLLEVARAAASRHGDASRRRAPGPPGRQSSSDSLLANNSDLTAVTECDSEEDDLPVRTPRRSNETIWDETGPRSSPHSPAPQYSLSRQSSLCSVGSRSALNYSDGSKIIRGASAAALISEGSGVRRAFPAARTPPPPALRTSPSQPPVSSASPVSSLAPPQPGPSSHAPATATPAPTPSAPLPMPSLEGIAAARSALKTRARTPPPPPAPKPPPPRVLVFRELGDGPMDTDVDALEIEALPLPPSAMTSRPSSSVQPADTPEGPVAMVPSLHSAPLPTAMSEDASAKRLPPPPAPKPASRAGSVVAVTAAPPAVSVTSVPSPVSAGGTTGPSDPFTMEMEVLDPCVFASTMDAVLDLEMDLGLGDITDADVLAMQPPVTLSTANSAASLLDRVPSPPSLQSDCALPPPPPSLVMDASPEIVASVNAPAAPMPPPPPPPSSGDLALAPPPPPPPPAPVLMTQATRDSHSDSDDDLDFVPPPPPPLDARELRPRLFGSRQASCELLDVPPPPPLDENLSMVAETSVAQASEASTPKPNNGAPAPPPPPPPPPSGATLLASPTSSSAPSSFATPPPRSGTGPMSVPPSAERGSLLASLRDPGNKSRLRSVHDSSEPSSPAAATPHAVLMASIGSGQGQKSLRRVRATPTSARSPGQRNSLTTALVNAMDARRGAMSDSEDDEQSDSDWED